MITAPFARFAKKERIEDATLIDAIERVERGLVDADLGGGVLKLRIARLGQGRSAGHRTIVACIVNDRAFFLYGFAKNELGNIGDSALTEFRLNAAELQRLTDEEMISLKTKGILREIER